MMMKSLLIIVAISALVAVCYGGVSQCYECKNGWEDPEECNQTAEAVNCNGNGQFVCSIEVKNEDGELGMRRRCINENACQNNMDKNEDWCDDANATVTERNKCVYCCDDHDLCNYDVRIYHAGATGIVVTLWLMCVPLVAALWA